MSLLSQERTPQATLATVPATLPYALPHFLLPVGGVSQLGNGMAVIFALLGGQHEIGPITGKVDAWDGLTAKWP